MSRSPRGKHGDGRAAVAGAVLHPFGVHSVVHHARGCARAVCAAVAGRRRRDGHVVLALEHVRAGPVRLDAREPPRPAHAAARPPGFFARLQSHYERLVSWTVAHGRIVLLAYLLATAAVVVVVGGRLGRELFPRVDTGMFQLRVRPPQGTHYELTHPDCAEDTRRDCRGSGDGQRRSHDGLRRGQSAEFRDQHGLPVEPRPRRQPASGRLARGKQGRHIRAAGAGCERPCPRRWAPGSEPRSSSAWASRPNRPTSASPT